MSENPVSTLDALSVLNLIPGSHLILLPDAPRFTIAAVTDGFLTATALQRQYILNKGVFEVLAEKKMYAADPGLTNLSDSLHRVMEQKTEQRMKPLASEECTKNQEEREIRIWSALNKPVPDAAGDVQYIIHTLEEITDKDLLKSQADTEIAEVMAQAERQKRLYETINGNTPDLIYVFDLSYRFAYANAALLTMWGKTADEAIGKRLLENGYEPWHAEMHEREIDQIVATKKPVRGEVSFPHAVLGKRVYDYILVPVFNKAGEVEAVAGTTRDITELKQAEESLIESERHLRTLIMQAPVAMCILLGPDHVVDIANDLMITLWGKPKETVMNKPIFEGLADAKEQGLETILSRVYTTGEPFKATEHAVELFRNGRLEMVYQNFVYEPYRDAKGNIVGVLAITTDVTEQVLARHRIEEVVAQRTNELAQVNLSLQHINTELQRSNQNLEEFAHAASHDLKEPIRKISFFTTKLKHQLHSRLNGAEAESFDRIENATERMGNLIDDLLLYSHVSQRPHETEAVDLNQQLLQVLEDLELNIEEKQATICVETLPVLRGYRRQLQQMFQNLVSNALKYSKPDLRPQITVGSAQVERGGKDYHVITVQDNGIGFEQQYEGKIFQMFARLHGKNEYNGTGVGLSIVKKVVENHQGLITAEGTPGEGAIFRVYLPVSM